MRRSLTIKRESLTELSTDELVFVNGADALPTGEGRCPTIPVDECARRLTAQLINNTWTCRQE